jgi:hypothetical protein
MFEFCRKMPCDSLEIFAALIGTVVAHAPLLWMFGCPERAVALGD